MIIALLILLLASCSHPMPAPVIVRPPPVAAEPPPIIVEAPKSAEPSNLHHKVQVLQYRLKYLGGLVQKRQQRMP